MAYKILIVDDEAHYADMLRDLLLQNNFIADMAVSVQQALYSLDSEDYALIIADYKMPGMDGAEFLQRVRMHNATIPFFMVSGLMNTHELIRVANLGTTLVFEKPLEIGTFIESVKKYIAPLSDAEFQKRFRGDVSGENYPSELIHLSDQSQLGKDFVQKLWLAFQRDRMAIVQMRRGAELELIAKEISHWKGRANSQFYTLTPEDFANPDCADSLNGIIRDPSVSPVVILQGVEGATTEQMEAITEFMQGGHFALSLHPELFFVLIVETNTREDTALPENARLNRLLRGRALELPPLCERPSDIARYARRLIAGYAKIAGDMSKAWLAPDTVGLLLQHPWRGEYDELSVKLEQIVTLDRACPLCASDFSTVLPGEENHPAEGYTLRRRLKLGQQIAIEDTMKRTGGELPVTLAHLGVTKNLFEVPQDAELIHPELLR